MGVAVIAGDSLSYLDVAGVRKLGNAAPEEIGDAWHLGSDTKAVTAVLIGKLVEQGRLSYGTTILQAFPELRGKILPFYDSVTLEMLLEHRAGLWHDWPSIFTRATFDSLTGSLRDIRLKFLSMVLRQEPEFLPGRKYSYSNAGYIIAAAMAERAANEDYESLVNKFIVQPLGMTSAGWGPSNRKGVVDNTWEHVEKNGEFLAVDNIPSSDNPPFMNPAGRLHLSLRDWSKFILTYLPGAPIHILSSPLLRLNTIAAQKFIENHYDDGWMAVDRPWASAVAKNPGLALNHAGSNGLNFANAWVVPERHFAVMVTVNAAGPSAEAAAEAIIDAALAGYLKR
jgi:CubicO group peptidase (beta-lactamase class C family)